MTARIKVSRADKDNHAGMYRMKRPAIILAALLAVAAMLILLMDLKTKSDLRSLVYADIDMAAIADGIYRGKAETSLIKAEVEVKTADHRIISVRFLQHDSGLGKKAEQITSGMVRMNTYDVDVISGATASSQVIKCAVSAALAGGQQK